jgi:flagellar hook-length control protein FliK
MPQTTTSPILPLDPAITAPRSRAAAAPKSREPFLLPEPRPDAPGARRAIPARPEASAYGQARAEARSTARGEPREPARSRRPDEPRASDRESPEGAQRPQRSGDGRSAHETGNAERSKATTCAGETAGVRTAETETGTASPMEPIAEEAGGDEGNPIWQEASETEPTSPGPANEIEVLSAQTESGTEAARPETEDGAPEAAPIEGLDLAGPVPTHVIGTLPGTTPTEPAPEVKATPQALARIGGEAPAPHTLASTQVSHNPAASPVDGAPEPGSSGDGSRPEALPFGQAATHAADAAQERGIQTASLATISRGEAPGASRAPAGVGAPGPATPPVPLGAVPIEVGLRSLAGLNRFEIRLDPAELGRIDVRLDIDDGGEVKAHLTVDRVETLALLQRDARTLERAFEQAGLKPSQGGIDLSLRDQASDPQGRGARDERRETDATASIPDETERRAEAWNSPAAAQRPLRWRSGIDVRV